MSFIRKPVPLQAQPKTVGSSRMRMTPTAPPVYRPQPLPRVLQTKLVNSHLTPININVISTRPVVPRVVQVQELPAVFRRGVNACQSSPGHNQMRQPIVAPPKLVAPRKVVQRFQSRIVQATKFYPNLHPGAAVPVERSNIFSLDNFADQYRLHRVNTHSVNVPNMKYNFVRTREGETLLHNTYRHPSLAEGHQVLYAGEVFFNNGNLQWWSNGSGHYQPDADGAEQANLPMEDFFSYQQIIKGEHLQSNSAVKSR